VPEVQIEPGFGGRESGVFAGLAEIGEGARSGGAGVDLTGTLGHMCDRGEVSMQWCKAQAQDTGSELVDLVFICIHFLSP